MPIERSLILPPDALAEFLGRNPTYAPDFTDASLNALCDADIPVVRAELIGRRIVKIQELLADKKGEKPRGEMLKRLDYEFPPGVTYSSSAIDSVVKDFLQADFEYGKVVDPPPYLRILTHYRPFIRGKEKEWSGMGFYGLFLESIRVMEGLQVGMSVSIGASLDNTLNAFSLSIQQTQGIFLPTPVFVNEAYEREKGKIFGSLPDQLRRKNMIIHQILDFAHNAVHELPDT